MDSTDDSAPTGEFGDDSIDASALLVQLTQEHPDLKSLNLAGNGERSLRTKTDGHDQSDRWSLSNYMHGTAGRTQGPFHSMLHSMLRIIAYLSMMTMHAPLVTPPHASPPPSSGLTEAHCPHLSPLSSSLQRLDLSRNLMSVVDEGLAALRELRELRLADNQMWVQNGSEKGGI